MTKTTSHFITRKIFEAYGGPNGMPRAATDAAAELGGEFGVNNGGYLNWCVVANPTGEEEGAGYLTDEQVQLLNTWLLGHGATLNEDVLIHISW